METPLQLLLSGALLGLAAGVSPGPLLALVIGETIRHDRRMGILVALAPLLTDLPIVVAAVYLLSRLAAYQTVLGVISLLGAAFIGYLAWHNIRSRPVELSATKGRPRSLQKGVLANFLNPQVYLFWITIGAPIVVRAAGSGAAAVLFFVAGFYGLLVGSKVGVAFLVQLSRGWLSGRAYLYLLRGLGVALLVLAAFFVRDGLRFLGLLG
jgi:threonine/homoserine/homoserine lactone efflux protein